MICVCKDKVNIFAFLFTSSVLGDKNNILFIFSITKDRKKQ